MWKYTFLYFLLSFEHNTIYYLLLEIDVFLYFYVLLHQWVVTMIDFL